jgi:DNA-directed RNA polymerase specialized sigma24 family protein
VSTRCERKRPAPSGPRPGHWTGRGPGRRGALDPAEEVALHARAKRELLLRTHRHWLRREDLEDCYSQATLELIAHVRSQGGFASARHLANALELRFHSRIQDRRRALGGRSPMQAALELALTLGEEERGSFDVIDRRVGLEELVLMRIDLRRLPRLARRLTPDQQLVLASQVSLEMGCAEFCRRFGWSSEKYRKVAQRARKRLRALSEEPQIVPLAGARSVKRTGTHL